MNLHHVKGRIVVAINLESKNSHRFEDGTEIKLARGYNNFNQREISPTNATVVSADYIESGREVLIHHNCTHDSNKIFDYKPLSGEEAASDTKYFSIKEDDCYAWIDGLGQLQPLKNYAFGLRVFKPYEGLLDGVEPTLIKDVLYVTTGALAGSVVHVLKNSDYEIIYQGVSGREDRVIRFRHSEDEEIEREEVVCVSHGLTELVQSGKLLVGYTKTDCQSLIQAYAD